MPNAGRCRSALRIAVVLGCLLLVFSVFAWGLHAKLSLYDANVVPSTATVAKLLLTQKTGRELIAVAAPVCPDLHALTLALLATLLVVPLMRVLWLQPETLRRRVQDVPWLTSIFSRPPPNFGAR